MRKKFLLSILIFFSFAALYGKDNYVKGFIITNDYDTVLGLIDFKTDLINEVVCRFKEDERATVKFYQPDDILGFRFLDEGKFYVSKEVNIEDGPKEKVFLEFLVQGMLNLYYLDDEMHEYYFFEDGDGNLISTTKKPDKIVDNKIQVDNRYKGTLFYIFREDAPLVAKTKDAVFERKSMIEYTKEYHDDMCKSGGSCIIFENDYKKRFGKLAFSVYTGMEYNLLRNIPSDFFRLDQMASISPVIGAELSFYNPRFNKDLRFMLDVNLSKVIGYDEYVNLSKECYYLYKYSAIKLTTDLGLKYIFTEYLFKPEIELAYSRVKMFDSEYAIHEEILGRNSKIEENNSRRDSEYTFIVGHGFRLGCGIGFPFLKTKDLRFGLLYYWHKPKYFEDILTTYQMRVGVQF